MVKSGPQFHIIQSVFPLMPAINPSMETCVSNFNFLILTKIKFIQTYRESMFLMRCNCDINEVSMRHFGMLAATEVLELTCFYEKVIA